MMFVASIGGISHAREEDTSDADLARGITAYGRQPSGCSADNQRSAHLLRFASGRVTNVAVSSASRPGMAGSG